MPIANDMKNIAEGIEVSYGERAAFLSDLSKGTNETLKTFHREHHKMAGDLWDSLSSDRDNREKIVASLRGKNKKELKAIAEQLANFLKGSTSAVKKDTAALMGQIREFINLVEKENSHLKKETDNLLSSFHASHEAMAKEQRHSLSSETKRQAGKVKEMLFTFDGEHKTRSNQLRRDISSFHKDLTSSVREMRNANHNDQRQARSHWQNLVRIMVAKRAGKAVTVAKKIEGVAKKEVAEAVEAFTAGSLKEQVVHLISEATSGITLTKMGKALGIAYVRLAKPASELVKEGKIKKEDSEYFKI